MSTVRQAAFLLTSIVICFAAAGLGSVLTRPSLRLWYAALRKPPWTPPNWIFGPVWTILYLCMAVAVWLVWRRAGFQGAKLPLAFFAFQLVLNVAWTGIFFTLHLQGFAFIEIIFLWLAILATTVAFWPLSKTAGWLMVPYLLWVAYAAALNGSIWSMNR